MKNANSMSQRLKQARMEAGFRSATAAIDMLKFNSSTYRAHENGQNNFNVHHAGTYAKAYGVSAAWLLVGDENIKSSKQILGKKSGAKCIKRECPEKIYALALLLRDDPQNINLLKNLTECIDGYAAFF